MLSLVTCVNGTFKIEAEGLSEQGAKVNFHQKCATLQNASDVITGTVAIMDEKLSVFGDSSGTYLEYISHEPQAEQGE